MFNRIAREYGFTSRRELVTVTAKTIAAGLGFWAVIVLVMAVMS